MWGDLYGRHLIYDAQFSSRPHNNKLHSCRTDALEVCRAVYTDKNDVESCQNGTKHGDIHDFSRLSEAYALGNLLEKFKCGGLRHSDQCVSYRTISTVCDGPSCTSKALTDNRRYATIELSRAELDSPDVTQLLSGELLSRLKC